MPPLTQAYLARHQGNGHATQPVERLEQLAVSLQDLARLDPLLRAKLLKGRLEAAFDPFLAEHAKDSVAVLLPVPLLTAAAVCDMLRSWDRELGDRPTRLWLRPRPEASWRRLPSHVVLTAIKDGTVILNPRWFSVTVVTTAAAPAAMQVVVGRKSAKRGLRDMVD